MAYIHALAVDYDGTIAYGPRPEPIVLEALGAARARGQRTILVTGRILDELRADFSDVDSRFDAIVAENGAVVACAGKAARTIGQPVGDVLTGALAARSVTLRRGQALLATDATNAPVILQEIARLGLDVQLLRNREALMVLPAGVSKGAGLREALGELGVSVHSTIGIGDAENDHSLLDACELGVAVANAIEPLKAHADVVLGERGPTGIARFIGGPIASGLVGVEPKRWRVAVGLDDADAMVTVPASQANIIVTGGSGLGKSYLAGGIAEQLIGLGYSVCVFDPEGDHAALGKLRGVVSVGGREDPPSPAQLARLTARRFGSVVVDLSLFPADRRAAYTRAALDELRKSRADTGVPHWILLDEAHVALEDGAGCVDPAQTGLCLITYRADLLGAAGGCADFVITLEAVGRARLERGGKTIATFRPAARLSEHVRHRHKYLEASLPFHHRFFFRDATGPTGRSAANLLELDRELARATPAVVSHHAANHDFSRWIADVITDATLAARAIVLERELAGSPSSDALGQLRRAIEDRYLEE